MHANEFEYNEPNENGHCTITLLYEQEPNRALFLSNYLEAFRCWGKAEEGCMRTDSHYKTTTPASTNIPNIGVDVAKMGASRWILVT
jgi:hypothetical protein